MLIIVTRFTCKPSQTLKILVRLILMVFPDGKLAELLKNWLGVGCGLN